MQIGPYHLQAVEAGRFRLDGGAMFGVVPRILWEKRNPPDASNRMEMATRCLLIDGPDGPILIDAGIGDKDSDKFRRIFAVEQPAAGLTGALTALGVPPEEIRHVILTHLHFDHCGGLTCLDPEGNARPVFPNAVHWLQQRQLDWARQPSLRDRASYLPANWEPVLAAGLGRIIDGDRELFPGIRVRCFHGHTPAMQLVEVADEGTNLIYCADLIPTSSHIRLPFVMGYDLEAIRTLREKEEFLPEVHERRTLLFYEHDPFHVVSRVVRTGDDFDLEPVDWPVT